MKSWIVVVRLCVLYLNVHEETHNEIQIPYIMQRIMTSIDSACHFQQACLQGPLQKALTCSSTANARSASVTLSLQIRAPLCKASCVFTFLLIAKRRFGFQE